MRICQKHRTPIERQVGEATAIFLESKKGEKTLLNSKSEFNRCCLPRVTAGNHRDILKTLSFSNASMCGPCVVVFEDFKFFKVSACVGTML